MKNIQKTKIQKAISTLYGLAKLLILLISGAILCRSLQEPYCTIIRCILIALIIGFFAIWYYIRSYCLRLCGKRTTQKHLNRYLSYAMWFFALISLEIYLWRWRFLFLDVILIAVTISLFFINCIEKIDYENK